MKIGIASDHRGFLKKQKVIKYLKRKGYNILDYGTNSSAMVDYPDYAFKVAEDVKEKKINSAILICSNGIGMAIAANKVKTIRCAKVSNIKEAKYSRRDNDCNIIAIGNNLSFIKTNKIITTFLTTNFANEERYNRRICKVNNYDN